MCPFFPSLCNNSLSVNTECELQAGIEVIIGRHVKEYITCAKWWKEQCFRKVGSLTVPTDCGLAVAYSAFPAERKGEYYSYFHYQV